MSNRHFPQKKFEWALKAFKKIPKRYVGQLVISGGPTWYTDHLLALVQKLRLTDRVVFVGLAKEDDLQKLYKHAAVYVYPAPEEDFGMGIIEAMASGTPVVAWDNAGPATTVIKGQTGFLVEPFNILRFAEATIEVLKDKRVYNKLRRRAIVHVHQNYTVKQHIRCLEKELLSIV